MILVMPVTVDSLPKPLDGIVAFHKSFRYPTHALEYGVSGSVIVQFTVDTSGHVYDVSIIDGPGRLTWQVYATICETYFVPAKSAGKSVPATVKLGLHFSFIRLKEIVETVPMRISEITFEVFPGLVPGPPDFTLTLDSSGVSRFEGRDGVDSIGSFTGTCSTSTYRRLESLFRDFCFFDKWNAFTESQLFGARKRITAIGNGEEVCHWATDSECMWGLSLILEAVSREIKWTRVH
jgi:TonB family protein